MSFWSKFKRFFYLLIYLAFIASGYLSYSAKNAYAQENSLKIASFINLMSQTEITKEISKLKLPFDVRKTFSQLLGIKKQPEEKQPQKEGEKNKDKQNEEKKEELSSPTPTPIPRPKPTPKPLPASNLDQLFISSGKKYGVNPEQLKRIALCESGLKPGASGGPYAGLFQFTAGTWRANRIKMGADPNPALRFDAKASIETAAFKIARDGTAAWPVCRFR